jgi:hypothetical protein
VNIRLVAVAVPTRPRIVNTLISLNSRAGLALRPSQW